MYVSDFPSVVIPSVVGRPCSSDQRSTYVVWPDLILTSPHLSSISPHLTHLAVIRVIMLWQGKVSSTSTIPSRTAWWQTGRTWRRYGITLSIKVSLPPLSPSLSSPPTLSFALFFRLSPLLIFYFQSCVWYPQSTPSCWRRLLSTPRPTGRGWLRSCSRPSRLLPYSLPLRYSLSLPFLSPLPSSPLSHTPSRLRYHCMHQDERQELWWVVERTSRTSSPSLMATPSLLLAHVSTWLDVT